MLEKPGPGQNLYTQKFRARGARAGSWLIAYTESPKNLVPGRTCILKNSGPRQDPGCWRIQKVRKAWIQAESVYSKIPGLGKLLVAGVYRKLENPGPRQDLYTQIFRAWAGSWFGAYTNKLEKPGPWAESVYSNFQGSSKLLVAGVYRKLEKPGSGQNQYTQKFRAQAGSCSLAYTVYSYFSGQGRLPIWSVYKQARKARVWAESVYSNFQGPSRLPIWSVYKKLEKSGPGQNQYTQIFRIQVGFWSLAYTESSKSQGPGRICILKNSGPGQVLARWRIQHARKAWARAKSVYSKIQGSSRFPVQGVYRKLKKSRAKADSR